MSNAPFVQRESIYCQVVGQGCPIHDKSGERCSECMAGYTPALMPAAFISRHKPTVEQHKLAASEGFELVEIGDMDAFNISISDVRAHGHFVGVVVVHPAAALRLIAAFDVLIFENSNRAPEDERPQFKATALHVFPAVGFGKCECGGDLSPHDEGTLICTKCGKF